MTVLSVAFTKIVAERKGASSSVKVNTNVSLTDASKHELQLGSAKQTAARFTFDYKVDYEPKIGEMLLQGEVIFANSKDKVEKLVSDWKKDKKSHEDVIVQVMNRLLNKSQLEALILSKELGLPSPVQLPRVSVAKKA